MKRSAELSALSRDHHHALHAALRLRRADDASVAAAVAGFLDFWGRDGQRHFRIEEDVLLPAFAAAGGDPRHQLVARVLTDHIAIRARARRLPADAAVPKLRELGDLLAAHIRLEENELFPLIEAALDPQALAALGEELARAERAG